MSLYVALEFGISFCHACFVSYLDALLSEITYNSAPEGVVKVEHEHFSVLSENGLDDV